MGNPAVLDAEAFQLPLSEKAGVSGILTEMDAIGTAQKAQVGNGGQVVEALIGDYPGIRGDQVGVVQRDLDDFRVAGGVKRGEIQHAFLLGDAFCNPYEQPGFFIKPEDAGIEQAAHLQSGSRADVFGKEQGIFRESFGKVFHAGSTNRQWDRFLENGV